MKTKEIKLLDKNLAEEQGYDFYELNERTAWAIENPETGTCTLYHNGNEITEVVYNRKGIGFIKDKTSTAYQVRLRNEFFDWIVGWEKLNNSANFNEALNDGEVSIYGKEYIVFSDL